MVLLPLGPGGAAGDVPVLLRPIGVDGGRAEHPRLPGRWFAILFGSKDAKKAYTHVVAAALRCKECTMEKATLIKENTDDILAEARKINEERAASVEVIEEAGQ